MSYYEESFTEYPTFSVINSGDGSSVVFSISHPTHSGFQYSRIFQTENIESQMSIVAQPVTDASYIISGLTNNTYYYFAMDSIAEISGGTTYNFWSYNFGAYNGDDFVQDGPLTGLKKVFVTDGSGGAEMQLPRLTGMSLIYLLRDIFESNGWYPNNLNIIDGYPEDKNKLVQTSKYTGSNLEKKLPIITVECLTLNGNPLELGSRDSYAEYRYSIDIFCEKDGQKEDLAYLIKKNIDNTQLNILNYNEGFPPVSGQTVLAIGDMSVDSQINTSVKNSPFIADRHSSRILLTVEVIEEY